MKSKPILQSGLIILAFLVAMYGRTLVHSLIEFQFQSYAVRIIYFYAWWIIPVFLVTVLLFGFSNVVKELGLNRGFISGLALASVLVFPMFAGSAWLGGIITGLNPSEVIRKTFLAGFMEELLFRGFLFGLLFRKMKWGFIPASVPAALIFGLAHVYQGSGMLETAGIFLVTFVGALWFAWLFVEWNGNLWVPIWLHILMNLSWALFFENHTALGGFGANIFRIITISLSVIITIIYCKRRKVFRINKSNLFLNTGSEE